MNDDDLPPLLAADRRRNAGFDWTLFLMVLVLMFGTGILLGMVMVRI